MARGSSSSRRTPRRRRSARRIAFRTMSTRSRRRTSSSGTSGPWTWPGATTRVTEGAFSVGQYAISPDGSRLVMSRAPSPLLEFSHLAELWVTDARGGDARQLTSGNRVSEGSLSISPDNGRGAVPGRRQRSDRRDTTTARYSCCRSPAARRAWRRRPTRPMTCPTRNGRRTGRRSTSSRAWACTTRCSASTSRRGARPP